MITQNMTKIKRNCHCSSFFGDLSTGCCVTVCSLVTLQQLQLVQLKYKSNFPRHDISFQIPNLIPSFISPFCWTDLSPSRLIHPSLSHSTSAYWLIWSHIKHFRHCVISLLLVVCTCCGLCRPPQNYHSLLPSKVGLLSSLTLLSRYTTLG